MKLVAIEWVDSRQPIPPWQFLEDFVPQEPVKIFSVGFIVHGGEVDEGEEESDVVALAPNVGNLGSDEAQISGVIHIPRGSIVEITSLTRTEEVLAQPEEEQA